MKVQDISRVAVIGTGVIGASWAARFLAAGLQVAAHDPADGAEAALRAAVARFWTDLQALGLTAGRDVTDAQARLGFHRHAADAAQGADFVQENAPERLPLKRALLAGLEPALRDDVVIASSTSGIMPTPMQQGMAHPGRLVIGHPFNPPHLVPLVEVVGGQQTDARSVDLAMAFYARIGKAPVRLNTEITGHIANRLQAALWREAVHLVVNNVASLADIDRALVAGPGLRWAVMGSNLTFHLAGGAGGIGHFLDHLGPAAEQWWDDLGQPHLDAVTCGALRDGVAQQVGGRPIAALEQARDAALLAVLQVPPVLDRVPDPQARDPDRPDPAAG